MRKMLVCAVVVFFLLSQMVYASSDGEYHPVPKSPDTHPAYIVKISSKGGKTYITADYIQWFEGEEANKVFRRHEQGSGLDEAPDGYYILNQSKKLRTFQLADNAEVRMQIYNRGKLEDTDVVWNQLITAKKFVQLFRNDGGFDLSGFPYHLTVKNGKIVKIVQQYIP